MKPDPLPAAFVAWLKAYVLSSQFTTVRRLHRGLILRWGFWLDGISENTIAGYDVCPKPTLSGYPAGWSYQKFHAIAKEAVGTGRVHAARAAAATYIDCGSGQHYGICKKCGKGHGHVFMTNGKPTALVTNS